MLIGGVLISVGHIALATSGLGTLGGSNTGISIFKLGLALIVTGTGHFERNVSVMVGQLLGDNDLCRDGAFMSFYIGINLGAFFIAFFCGTLGERFGWHRGVGAAAAWMLAGLGVYLWRWRTR